MAENPMERRRLDWLLPSWLEDSSAFDQDESIDLEIVLIIVALNLFVAIVLFSFFSYARQKYPLIYRPKAAILPDQTPPALPATSMWSWVLPLYNVSDQTVIDYAGYDAVIALRFYYMAFRVFFYFSPYAFFVLLPLNYTGGVYEEDTSDLNSFDRWTMSNIEQKSDRLWFHLVGLVYLTGLIMRELINEFKIYIRYRHNFLRRRNAHLRTVLVESIPKALRSPTQLARYFHMLYPGKVQSVYLCRNFKRLGRLTSQQEETVRLLERYIVAEERTGQEQIMRLGLCGEGKQVSAVRWLSSRLATLNDMVEKEHSRAVHVLTQENEDMRRALEEHGLSRFSASSSSSSSSSDFTPEEEELYRRSSELMADMIQSTSIDTNPLSTLQMVWREGEEDKDGENEEDEEEMKFDGLDDETTSLIGDKAKKARKPKKTAGGDEEEGKSDSEQPSSSSPKWYGSGARSEHLSPSERGITTRAFITFNSFVAATIARQVLHAGKPSSIHVNEAPDPTDIFWPNVYVSRSIGTVRRVAVDVVVVLLIILYVAPVTLIGLITNVDNLRTYSGFIDSLCSQNDFYYSLFELVQPLALLILMSLLPPLLLWLGRVEGTVAASWNQLRTFSRYYAFQIINVFLVTTIAGSVLDSLQDILSDPSSVLETLGESLPQVSGFFCSYLTIKALSGASLEISRLMPYVQHLLKIWFTPHTTPRDRKTVIIGAIRTLDNPGWFPYAKFLAQDMLVCLISMAFGIIAPLTLVASLAFFFIIPQVYKHQMLYVYEPDFETGGQFFPKIFRRWIFALFMTQVTMTGLFILKEAWTEVYVTAGLLVLTYLYKVRMRKSYETVSSQLPLDVATFLDQEEEHQRRSDPTYRVKGAEMYLQPELRGGLVEVEGLVRGEGFDYSRLKRDPVTPQVDFENTGML